MSGLSSEESSDEGDVGSGDRSSPSPAAPSTPTPQLHPIVPSQSETLLNSVAPQPTSTTIILTTTTTTTTTATTTAPTTPPSPTHSLTHSTTTTDTPIPIITTSVTTAVPASPPPVPSSHHMPVSASSPSPTPPSKPRQLISSGTVWPVMPSSPTPSNIPVATTSGITTVSQVQPTWSSVVQPPLATTTVPRLSPGNLVPPLAHGGSAVQTQVIGRLVTPVSSAQSPVVSQYKSTVISSASVISTVSSVISPGLSRTVVTGSRVPSVPQLVTPSVTRPTSLTVVAPVASVGLAVNSPVTTTSVSNAVRPVSNIPSEERGSVVRAPVSSVPHSVLASLPGTPPITQDKPIKVKSEADVVRFSPGVHPALRPSTVHGFPQAGIGNASVSQAPSTTVSMARMSPAPAVYNVGITGTPPTTIQSVSSRSPLISGSGVPQYPGPPGIIKPEHIKREPEFTLRPEKIKYEQPLIPSDSFKSEIVKTELKSEIKLERGDRPEIIAEIKSEPRQDIKPTISSGASSIVTTAALSSLPAHLTIPGYPYPYSPYGYPIPMHYSYTGQPRSTSHRPHSPSQRPSSTGPSLPISTAGNSSRVSPNPVPLATGSSTLTTSSTTTKPTPTLGAHSSTHLGPSLLTSRPGIPPHLSSPGKLPTSQPSPVPPGLRPPGSAVGLPGMSPGLPPGMPPGMVPTTSGGSTTMPTPPAAHTGPVVKPPSMPVNLTQPPAPTPGQPPTTQALPATVPPSHPAYPGGPSGTLGTGGSVHEGEEHEDDDDPPSHREPSPEPKIEDSEFHRSESAM